VDRKRVQALVAELLNDAPARTGFRRAMHAERLAQVDGTRLLARGDARFIEGVAGGGTMPLVVVAGVLRPIVYEDGVMMVRHTTAVAESAAEETWPDAKARTPQFPLEIKRSVLHINASLLMPALSVAAQRHYWTIMDRRAAALVLAIRLYAIDHDGNLPEQLEDLVPTYLPKVPVDPFAPDAGPMKYLRAPQPIIYSVNVNGKDDAGSNMNTRGGQAQNNWDSLDAVFHLTRQPRPVEEEEENEPEPDLPPDLIEPEVTTQPAPAQESIEIAPQ
jgi:hypothetical protein